MYGRKEESTLFCLFVPKSETVNPVSLKSSNEELRERVDSLTEDEAHVYKWLREYYSERWIAETLLINRAQFKELAKSLCRKLGVSNIKAMLRIYNRLDIPKLDEPINTGTIDGYVEKRTEKEIRKILEKDP